MNIPMARRAVVAAATSVSLVMTVVGPAPLRADPVPVVPLPELQRQASVPGGPVPVRPPQADPAMDHAIKALPPAQWPAGGSATVDLPGGPNRIQAGAQPVWVARAGLPSEQAGRVRVELLDQAAVQQAGIAGVLMRLSRADGAAGPGKVSLEVDYAAFRTAFGGDFADRLRLVSLPACALTTPGEPSCLGAVLPTRNDVVAGRASATVTVGDGTVLALAAGPSGSAGSLKATTLSPSATWQAGGPTGDFAWTYPVQVPPGPAAQAPQIALAYSSGSIDGRTSATNNQASWIGEGFDFSPGYIERKYKPCAEDMAGGNNSRRTGDSCWFTDNATMSLNGRGGELIRDDASGRWQPRHDDGSRVDRFTGAANGDDNGEHWRVTTQDGTQYHFGLVPASLSTWTVPVYGNHATEPCHGGLFAASMCPQAYRWNLDRVVDTHGNVMTYHYAVETNHYGRDLTASAATPYTRGGWLSRIEYGLRGGVAGTAPARALFTTAERCLPSGTVTCAPEQLTNATARHWPDVPWDQNCGAGQVCTDRYSPTFWTRKRLVQVTTQILTGTAYQDVDSWALTHAFPDPGDGTVPALWLESIRRTGYVGGGSLALPAVSFDGFNLPNRVDATEGIVPLYRYRVARVYNETGGVLGVTYSDPECRRADNLPAHPATNGKRCMPSYWAPEGHPDPILDWFHKYLVTQVTESDLVGGSPDQFTHYDYVGMPAWHYDDNDLVPERYRTWGQWRGFERVRVRSGLDGGQQSLSEYLYFRGMDDDRTATGGRRDVRVRDSEQVLVDDHERFQGMVREEIHQKGVGGEILSATITDQWLSAPSGRQGDLVAYKVDTARVRARTRLADGTWRRTEVRRTFDTAGILLRVDDLADPALADDDRCTRYAYARNTTKWILSTVSRVETVARHCNAAPAYPADAVSDVRTYYDGSTVFGAVPTKGDVTRVEEVAAYPAGVPSYVTTTRAVHDAYGRPVEAWDARDARTTTSYSPVTGLTTQLTITNALGHASTAVLDPARGLPLVSTEAGGLRTDMIYDQLGRLVTTWLPGRSKAAGQSPSGQHEYLVGPGGPPVVTTTSLQADGGYKTGYELFDGRLRLRQTQQPAVGGGRVVSDIFYDARGLISKANGTYFNAGPPSAQFLAVADNAVPGQTVTTYDGAGRREADIFRVFGVERWRTTITYGGDRISVDPPDGGVATSTVTDARGRTTELRQYTSGAPTGGNDVTAYTYDRAGRLATVADPGGNTWRYQYDVRGRLTVADDPDKGATTSTYNDADELVSTVDARGQKLAYVYDPLGRPTTVHDGSISGPKRTETVYDTLLAGAITSSTRYTSGGAYTTRVLGYDGAGRPTGTAVSIPASEQGLAGSHELPVTYTTNGEIASMTYPAAGGLPAETVNYGYDQFGLPSTTSSGLAGYVSRSEYSEFGEPLRFHLGTAPSVRRVWQTFFYEDGTRRLLRAVTDREATGPRQGDVNYTYDPSGQIVKIADRPTHAPAETQCFDHDHLGRLTQAWTATNDCATGPAAPVVGGPAPYWHSFSYDKVGNRLTEVRHATGGDTTRTYGYPPAGATQRNTLRTVRTAGPGGERLDEYGYDAAGNMTARRVGTDPQTLEWDPEGHLTRVTEAGRQTSFVYDADGQRLIRRDPTGTTLYLGATELRRDAATGQVRGVRHYAHGGATMAVRTTDGVTWMVPDHHGTDQIAIDSGDASVNRRRYTPFGQPRGGEPTWPDEHGFVGGTVDAAIGLTTLGARQYEADTGRFISVDPIIDNADPRTMHPYAYANNSPVSLSDPTGLRVCEFCDGSDGNKSMEAQSRSQGTGSGGTSRPDPYNNPDVRDAREVNKKSILDVVIEAGGKILREVLGVDDVRNCVTKGDVGACIGVIIGAVPWGKIFKVVKAAWKAVRAVISWRKKLEWAAGVLKRADEAAAAAAKQADEAAAAAAKRVDDAAKQAAAKADDAAKKGDDATRHGDSCKANSFTPGTPVLMADGGHKPIENVELGDQVAAADPESGRSEPRTVIATIVGDGTKQLVEVVVDTDGTVGDATGAVVATAGHPFWVPDLGQWRDASSLAPGDSVLTPTGEQLFVLSVRHWTGHHRVHNLTVDGIHTYHVAVGDTDVLVHNCKADERRNPFESVDHQNRRYGAAGEFEKLTTSQFAFTKGALHRTSTTSQATATKILPAHVGAPAHFDGTGIASAIIMTAVVKQGARALRGWWRGRT